ncbi:hypothetical protein [Actinokineospora bangkokensis]|uniref:AAA+ ATPase domain-containing protein n=1 Tax=Actinokineospora bangkokensis TaxID=1193682 RepID=A0A1Q9LPA6_9PSEU|nr:hypothetical protein [Actinokineospora bangkokensis]OLR93824.1 hypothetical protein BJP25_16490 [Actinokineospora bangkokensis]
MSAAPPPRRRRNPFADMAVANVSVIDGDPDTAEVTVTTDAVRTAFSFLDDYLDAHTGDGTDGADDRAGGTVIALLGDYGIGKTHLSVRMVARARARLGNPRAAVYLDAAAADFLSLYRRFMATLGVDGVVAQVNDYYADQVAEALEPSGLTRADVRAMTGADAEGTDPGELRWHEIARELGLLESRLLRQVRETLAGVTSSPDFAAALTLLLRPGFQEAVWNWLTGGRPEQILVDRGVSRVIDDDLAALEALRVFALLLGGRDRRFVLVVDELDKIFSAQHAPGHAVMAEFQELLQVATKAGACLVLGGLPEVWPALSGPVRARIPHPVRLAGLTEGEITDFILRTQELTLGTRTLAPFTPPVVRTIRMITRGNPREVIRLCHRAFRLADDRRRQTGDESVLVDDAIINQANTELFGTPSGDDIRDQIGRVLGMANWDHYRDRVLGARADTRVDYWVRFPQRGSGCALLLTRALLTDADVEDVVSRIISVRGAEPHAVVLPLVTGTPTDMAVARVREQLGYEPVLYRQSTFVDDLVTALETAMARLPELDAADPVGQVLAQTDQIIRRMATMHRDLLEQIQHGTDRVESAVGRSAPVEAPTTPPAADEPGLPAPVAELFAEAVAAIQALTTVDPEVSRAFEAGGYEAADAALRIVERPDVVAAAGTGRLLAEVVVRFRASVAGWFRRFPPAPGAGVTGGGSAEARAALEGICNVYDAMAEYLPTFRLLPLASVAGRPEDAVARVEEALRNLSFRVRRAALRAAAGR